MKKVLILLTGILCLGFTSPNKPLTKQALWKEINQAGIQYPDLVFAQALLESGDLKSTITRLNKNVFGMKLPSIRSTTAIGQKRGHALFTHWTESVKDYKLYQEFVFKKKNITSRKAYIRYLNKVYSEVNDYSKRLSRVLLEHKLLIQEYEERKVLQEAYTSN